MLGHRTLNLEDYSSILKRRWWIIVLPALILPVLAFLASFLVQPEYLSQTLVLVEQQKVPEDFVKPVIAEDLSSRLASMKEQILSRSRLQPIIERFNLFGTAKTSMDDRITQMRANIDIKPIRSELAHGGLPGFFIGFKAGDARTAQAVCGEITTLFVNENLKSREASAVGTTDFLKQQLADAKRNLDEQDAKFAKFQQTYVGKLPGEEMPNMNMLTSLNTQLDAATQSLARDQSDRSYEEAMLSQATRESQVSEPGKSSPMVKQQELQQLVASEAELSARYTPDYPDVVAARRKIADLRREIAETPPPPPVAAAPNPNRVESASVAQLRAHIRGLDQSIAQKKHDQAAVQAQIRLYQDRVQSSPMVQEQFKALTRDHQTAQQFYDDLSKRMNDSKMATDLERRQQGEQFRVMDEPNLPDAPTSPKRPIFAAGGLALGVALGLGIVGLLEYRDKALRSERDIWAFTKLPTLASISLMDGARPADTKKTMRFFKRRAPEPGGKPLMNTGA